MLIQNNKIELLQEILPIASKVEISNRFNQPDAAGCSGKCRGGEGCITVTDE